MGQDIKATICRIYHEIFTQGKLDLADEIFAPDFVDHFPTSMPGQPTTGPHAVKWFATFLRDAFPDLQVTVESVIAEGDEVAARAVWRGTHQHQLGFIPPTSKHIIVQGVDMARVSNGLIAEHWGGWNMASLMQQLGALPEPEGTRE